MKLKYKMKIRIIMLFLLVLPNYFFSEPFNGAFGFDIGDTIETVEKKAKNKGINLKYDKDLAIVFIVDTNLTYATKNAYKIKFCFAYGKLYIIDFFIEVHPKEMKEIIETIKDKYEFNYKRNGLYVNNRNVSFSFYETSFSPNFTFNESECDSDLDNFFDQLDDDSNDISGYSISYTDENVLNKLMKEQDEISKKKYKDDI